MRAEWLATPTGQKYDTRRFVGPAVLVGAPGHVDEVAPEGEGQEGGGGEQEGFLGGV